MSIERYRALMEQLHARFAIENHGNGKGNISNSAQATHLNIRGISFHAYYGGVLAPDHVMLYCEFGAVPPHMREEILLRLLEMNTYVFSIRTASFSYDQNNEHIVLISRLDLQQISLPAVLETLEDIVQMAQQWQRDYFLMSSTEESCLKH